MDMNKTILSAFFLSVVIVSGPALGDSQKSTKHQFPFQYVVENTKGSVRILSAGSKAAEPAEEDQTVRAGDEVITGDNGEVSLTLNETTMFHLSSNSDVKVADLSRKGDKGFLSRLKLIAGNILAEVEKLAQSHSSFEVESGGVVCGVRGTAFEVQKEGSQVQTNTFEGVVEMKKGGESQKVPADKNGTFATDRGAFLLQRAISDREKARYENWLNLRELVRRRQAERAEALKVFDSLPQTKQDELWQKMEQVKAKDRLKELRRVMREQNLLNHLKVQAAADSEREGSVKEREQREEEARQQRLKNLKKKHPVEPPEK